MPMYDFRCNACNNTFEELVPRDYKSVKCPSCKSEDTARLMSVFSARTSSGDCSKALCTDSTPNCTSYG